jgi:hypothetical protein
MIKNILKYIAYFFIIIIISVIYLSYFGIETKRFNELIKEEVKKTNQNIDVELDKVKILLNPTSLNISLKTYRTKILFENKKINLEKVETNFSINSFLKEEFAIENLNVFTEKNDAKDILSLIRIYKNTPQIFIFDKMLKGGTFIAEININFDTEGKIKNNYKIKGKAENFKINLLNKNSIKKVNLDFEVGKKKYLFKKIKAEFKDLKLLSNKIQIDDRSDYFLIKGDISNSVSFVKTDTLSFFFNNKLEENTIEDVNFTSENNFSFKLNKKIKFSDIDIKSKIELKKLKYLKKNDFIKKFLPNYKETIELKNHILELSYFKDSFLLKGYGEFLIDNISDKISYNIKYKDKNYDFESKIQLENFPFKINFLDYEKEKGLNSILELKGSFKKNKYLILKNILFNEGENLISINDLKLNKSFKIKNVKSVELDYINKNKKNNKISLSKNKKNYKIKGKNFDGSSLLENLLNGDKTEGISKITENLNSDISISVDTIYTDNKYFLKNLYGNLKFTKNNLETSNLEASFNNNKRITFKVYKNSKNEKITTLFSEFAEPIVKKYKFIKGFEEGILDFVSIKKNKKSVSQLKIYDFKLQEVPALTKILTLASLQGIADLLTGEGIRFNEFEMNFNNKNTLMTIDEIYAIGPAISILMNGYIEEKKLVSLRGTLVPATTLNKVVGSIPFLGNILVGSKTGEGVFGVSFKIKGQPKDLKTTVNPIKTLTPRFITRTLEKIKKESK